VLRLLNPTTDIIKSCLLQPQFADQTFKKTFASPKKLSLIFSKVQTNWGQFMNWHILLKLIFYF
jgi:hypothetical protein